MVPCAEWEPYRLFTRLMVIVAKRDAARQGVRSLIFDTQGSLIKRTNTPDDKIGFYFVALEQSRPYHRIAFYALHRGTPPQFHYTPELITYADELRQQRVSTQARTMLL